MSEEIVEQDINGGNREPEDVILGTPSSSKLTIDGVELAAEIGSIELQQYIDNHHVLKVRLHNPDVLADGSTTVNELSYSEYLGASLSLTITPEGEQVDRSRDLTFVGTVTNVEMEYGVDGISFDTITAHSPTIAMDGAKQNAFFFDQTASDTISSIVSNHPVTQGSMESIGGTSKFTVQYRETDYQFVMRLATGAGKFAFYDGQEFRVVKAAGTDTEELIWRETLGSFKMGLGTASANFTSEVYNYEQKKNFAQDTNSLSQEASLSQISQLAPDASEQIYRKSGFSTSPKVVADAQSLDKILLNDKSRAMDRMINCSGQSDVPALAVGHAVKIESLGPLNATYWVTAVHHKVDETGSYHNRFQCTPLDIAFPQSRSSREQALQIHSAEVVANDDPDQLGRIKVKYPWMSEGTIWVRFMTPHAGQEYGWYSVPEIGDEVLVGFEQGNPDHPIVLGALYNNVSKPPGDAPNEEDNIKLFRTRGGNQIKINDEDGSEEIAITTKDGENEVVLNMSGPSISIKSSGDISLKGKNISIEADQDITVKSGSNLKSEAGANCETKASGNLKVDGAKVEISGSAGVDVKGATINLN